MREHARETAAGHHLHEGPERGEYRRTTADRPGRVHAKVRNVRVEQGEERRLADAARKRTEGVDGGDGGKAVERVRDRLAESRQGRSEAVVPCRLDQVDTQPHAAEGRRRAPDGIQGLHQRTRRVLCSVV